MALVDDDSQSTFLGVDLGTKKLKAVVLCSQLSTIAQAEVDFDADLPEFNTIRGANPGPNPNEYFANPVMWVKGVDVIMGRLKKESVEFKKIAAIGVSAQQHGSVFWSHYGVQRLQYLDHCHPLHAQLNEAAFAVKQSPIWMDGSTDKQCAEMERAIGGSKEMVNITGSKCYPRFAGPQIRKIYQQQEQAYKNTARISLVSSFLASLFVGNVAPIDYSDGSGMNLLDINKRSWSKACLAACAPDLAKRLGTPANPNDIVGDICNYFIDRYGFSRGCKVAASTGDNPASLAGMLLRENWLVISLRASDTVMMHLDKHPKLQAGHVLCHPTEPCEFMGMLSFRNGSLVRELVKREQANDDWDEFNNLLDTSPKGNEGDMALHFNYREIIPKAKGILRWARYHTEHSVDAMRGRPRFDTPQAEVRALIEGQFIHKRAVAIKMGFNFGKETNLIVTGGGSMNSKILQVISDVFNAPVYIQKNKDTPLYGAAYRAKYAFYAHFCCGCPLPFSDYIIQYIPDHLHLACEPSEGCNDVYEPMLARFNEMARTLMKMYEKRSNSIG